MASLLASLSGSSAACFKAQRPRRSLAALRAQYQAAATSHVAVAALLRPFGAQLQPYKRDAITQHLVPCARSGRRLSEGWGDSLDGEDDIDYGSLLLQDLPDDGYVPEEEETRGRPTGRRSGPRLVNGKPVLVNEDIRSREVRLLGQDKENLGVVSTREALEMADEEGVDVVVVSPDSEPPLARLVTFSKYKYEIERASKDKAKAASKQETKEIRMRPVTDVADFQVKVRSAQKFLSKGAKVKLTMRFEGREQQYKEQGKEFMLKFVEECASVGKVDGPLNFKTGTYTVMLAPNK